MYFLLVSAANRLRESRRQGLAMSLLDLARLAFLARRSIGLDWIDVEKQLGRDRYARPARRLL